MRFRLRTLFAITFVVAGLGAAWWHNVQPQYRQLAAINELSAAGWTVAASKAPRTWIQRWVGTFDASELYRAPLKNQRGTLVSRDAELLTRIGDLPALTKLKIQREGVGDQVAAQIGRLSKLEVLSAWRNSISDQGMLAIGKCRNLQMLDLHLTHVTDRGLKSLENMEQLSFLILGKGVSGPGLRSIAKLKRLDYLNLRDTCITAAGLTYLEGCQARHIVLPRCRLTAPSIAALDTMPNLEELEIFDFDQSSVDALRSYHREDALSLNGTRLRVYFKKVLEGVSMNGMKAAPTYDDAAAIERHFESGDSAPLLEQCSSSSGVDKPIQWPRPLRDLGDVSERMRTRPTVFGYQSAGVLPRAIFANPGGGGHHNAIRIGNVRHVYLPRCSIENAGRTKGLFSLTSLHIDDPSFSEAVLQKLVLSRNFRILTVPHGTLSENAVLRFEALNRRATVRFRDPAPSHTDAFVESDVPSAEAIGAISRHATVTHVRLNNLDHLDLSPLAALPNLRSLELHTHPSAPTSHWQLTKPLPNVTVFHATDCSITDESMSALGQLPAIVDLCLAGAAITDNGLEHLQEHSSLKYVDLRGLYDMTTLIRGEGLQWLKGCEDLRELDLSGNPIQGESLRHLLHFPKLHKLGLSQTEVDDVGCRHLAQLPNLTTLHLTQTHSISEEGLKQLVKSPSLVSLKFSSEQLGDTGLLSLSDVKKLLLARKRKGP